MHSKPNIVAKKTKQNWNNFKLPHWLIVITHTPCNPHANIIYHI